MYVLTFYSFKGGVGRTFALVNVGVQLAQTGRKVLLVDFDLDAPGVATFDLLRPPQPRPGVVEFVARAVESGEAPDVREFVYPAAGVGDGGGQLWVMPAGRGDDAYRRDLASLNWQALYAQGDGYVLLEDLKAQWQEALQPDYVLIDSRTGYTDVQGICTRQLPDAVVLLFFPSQQNLAGLRPVVADIRSETRRTRKSPIKLFFVMSNVPDLDDEEQILSRRIDEFRKELEYEEEDAVVHRYDRLALLNQVIFTRDRPRSRLSREYQQLTEKLVRSNLEDRETALQSLRDLVEYRKLHPWDSPPHSEWEPQEPSAYADLIERIVEKHINDPEILYYAGLHLRQNQRTDEALRALDQSYQLGNRSPQVLLTRAELHEQLKDYTAASRDLDELMNSAGAAGTLPDVIRLALRVNDHLKTPRLLERIPSSPAVQELSLSGKLLLVRLLQRGRSGLPAAVAILQPLLREGQIKVDEHEQVRREMVRCLIGSGRFEEALRTISPSPPDPEQLSPELAFHYGVAAWAATRKLPKECLERSLAEGWRQVRSASLASSLAQRTALACWALGRRKEAQGALDRGAGRPLVGVDSFSYWRYLVLPPANFRADCDAIRDQLRAGADFTNVRIPSGEP